MIKWLFTTRIGFLYFLGIVFNIVCYYGYIKYTIHQPDLASAVLTLIILVAFTGAFTWKIAGAYEKYKIKSNE